MLDKLPQVLADKIMPEPMSGCWLWVGGQIGGYGSLYWNGKSQRAHRVIYAFFRGEIPDGLVMDHLCRLPACVNPDHLEPVTDKINTQRGLHGVLRTQCSKGHPYGDVPKIDKRGQRVCVHCARVAKRKYKKKIRLLAKSRTQEGK